LLGGTEKVTQIWPIYAVFHSIFENGFFQIKVINVRSLGIFLGKKYLIEDMYLSGCLDLYKKSNQKIRLHDA
jgi:hypothetical protein